MRSGERDEDGRAAPSRHGPALLCFTRGRLSLSLSLSLSLLILVVEGQEFAVGPFIRGNLSRRWASGINSAP